MALHPVILKLLAARGISPEEVPGFLDTSAARLVRAESLPGMTEATEAILRHIRARSRIVVFGDYDCDGVCASAILVSALQRLGANATAFMPDRFAEGYGMTAASVARMREKNPDAALVITVDNGICSAPEVADLKAAGIDVVVTDHHIPPETLPVCDALVNPKVASAPGCDELCGAGVAFFLANALVNRATAEGLYAGGKFAAPLLVLAGVATVADIVPLREQNRILVANAVRAFSAAPPGLRELRERALKRAADVTSRDFGFLLAPRINAAGRMADAREAYDLLMATEREEARRLAQAVDTRNAERKTVERRMADEALAQIADPMPAGVVVSGEGWHAGVSGIVAARLLERTCVPTAVVVDGRGSARAPEGYNIHDVLSACAEALDRFGGHAAAGGFSVRDGALEAFTHLFTAACARQAADIGRVPGERPRREPDLWVDPDDLTLDLFDAFQSLEPFGEGNPEPLFGLRGVVFSEIRLIGSDGRHASFAFVDRRIPRAVWWLHGDDAETLRHASAARYDVTFRLTVSEWGGEPHLELKLEDVWPSGM